MGWMRLVPQITLVLKAIALGSSLISGILAETVAASDRALVEAICGANNVVDEVPSAEMVARCGICPEFTTEGQQGFGRLPVITAVTYGSFTAAQRQEAVADLSGCEAHAANFGGSVLLRRSSGDWEMVRYELAYRSHDCLPFRSRQQRDLLVCQSSYAQGGYVLESLDLHEVNGERTESERILSTESNIASCRPPFFENKIVDFDWRDSPKGSAPNSWPDLTLTLSTAEAVPQTSVTECGHCCKANFSEPTLTDLNFRFNGDTFAPTSETAQKLQQLKHVEY